MEFASREVDAPLRALLVAVDGGPRETLAPLAVHYRLALADVDDRNAQHAGHWARQLALAQCELLVVGTSDSARAREVESAARRAARSASLPIAAIEDFPGNYCAVEGGEAALLVVESDSARAIAHDRLGTRTPALAVVPLARYDQHRVRAAAWRRQTHERWGARNRRCVLWAGQPETADCLATLELVLPALRAQRVELLFKAHPRDSGYLSGAYGELLARSGVEVTDVTSADVPGVLALAPHLVITQFSSVALEAGFYGVPSAWVLVPGAGAQSLHAKKGYRVPALCAAGGAGLASHAEAVAKLLDRSLDDAAYRARLIARFDAYMRLREAGTPRLAEKLRACLSTQ